MQACRRDRLHDQRRPDQAVAVDIADRDVGFSEVVGVAHSQLAVRHFFDRRQKHSPHAHRSPAHGDVVDHDGDEAHERGKDQASARPSAIGEMPSALIATISLYDAIRP